MWPSIENTPSVAIIVTFAAEASSSRASSSPRSPFAYRSRCALQSRIPSMIDAWLS